MPRTPPLSVHKLIPPGVGIEAVRRALNPLSNFSRCESAAFVQNALGHAIRKDLGKIHQSAELVPTEATIGVASGASGGLRRRTCAAIQNEQDIERAALVASAQLRKARQFFEQAKLVSDEIKPILYYYGGTYFLDFVCANLVRPSGQQGGGHGLKFETTEDGWEFDDGWPSQKCHVKVEASGAFPYYVDALTLAGMPTFFSRFRLHKNLKTDPWSLKPNPAPLFKSEDRRFTVDDPSLQMLCNFDRSTYLAAQPDVQDWLLGADKEMVWRLTSLLMDLMLVFVAASLARYRSVAWGYILGASKSPVYNDIREAYRSVSEGLPLYFEDEYPFQYCYETRIPPY